MTGGGAAMAVEMRAESRRRSDTRLHSFFLSFLMCEQQMAASSSLLFLFFRLFFFPKIFQDIFFFNKHRWSRVRDSNSNMYNIIKGQKNIFGRCKSNEKPRRKRINRYLLKLED